MRKNIKKVIRKSLILYLFIGLFVYSFILVASQQADPQSTTYDLKSYDFGSGGGGLSNTSTTYSLFGEAGSFNGLSLSSTTYKNLPGLTFELTANVPPAPTVSNESSQDYNKLKITINTGGSPTDYQYAIAISTDNFTTTNYLQADGTTGASPIWQVSGGAGWSTTNLYAIGLSQNTTYYFKVSAKQGKFTQSAYSAVTSVATAISSFTFSLNRNSVSIGSLTPGNVITAGNTVTTTVSTNGTGGAIVSVYGANNGLLSNSVGYTISSSSTNLGSAIEGYGLQGTTTSQTSGGPMEILSPYNVSANNVGAVTTTKQAVFDSTGAPVTSGNGTFQIMAKAGNSTKAAADYADTITVIASGTF